MVPAVTKNDIKLPNGIRMPILGLGTTHSGGYSHDAVVYALKHCGYRMIDTAKRYDVEIFLAKAIQESGIARSQLFLTSKLWPVDYGVSTSQACKASCSRLNTDYLDLYLLHFPEVPSWFKEPKSVVLEDTWRAMERLYENGTCRSIGVSNFQIADLEELMDNCSVKPHVNQFEFHPYYNPKELRKFCQQENILFTGYCPLAKGTILNEPILKTVADSYGKSVAQVCLRWSVQNNVAAIPKSLKCERLCENAQIFDFDLDDCHLQMLDNLHDENRKQVVLTNLQEKFTLPAGYKLQVRSPSPSHANNTSSSPKNTTYKKGLSINNYPLSAKGTSSRCGLDGNPGDKHKTTVIESAT